MDTNVRLILTFLLALLAVNAAVPAAARMPCDIPGQQMAGMEMHANEQTAQAGCCPKDSKHSSDACRVACDAICSTVAVAPASGASDRRVLLPPRPQLKEANALTSQNLRLIDPPPRSVA